MSHLTDREVTVSLFWKFFFLYMQCHDPPVWMYTKTCVSCDIKWTKLRQKNFEVSPVKFFFCNHWSWIGMVCAWADLLKMSEEHVMSLFPFVIQQRLFDGGLQGKKILYEVIVDSSSENVWAVLVTMFFRERRQVFYHQVASRCPWKLGSRASWLSKQTYRIESICF